MKHFLILICLLLATTFAAAAPLVEFHDTERIIFLGNEFFEHEQDQCYIEMLLTTRFPEKNLSFRNLGYAGDTVRADARTLCSGWDQFGPPDQGFGRLTKLVNQIKPTLVFVAYGMNESFEGEAGLAHFRQGLNRLLDMLGKTGARIVLLSPIPHEGLGSPLPDPAPHNKSLALYSSAIQDVATQRGLAFIDLLSGLTGIPGGPLTSDGIHLTAHGYRVVATILERKMGYTPRGWGINIDATTGSSGTTGITVQDMKHASGQVSFSGLCEMLPAPSPLPREDTPVLQIRNLAPGNYALRIDQTEVATATANAWTRGLTITTGPDAQQTESLRKLIIDKNFDFFNYWRPQNDTYIFGYRNHEQGRNAVEIPKFEQLLPEKEAEIAKLRVPVSHHYVLVRLIQN